MTDAPPARRQVRLGDLSMVYETGHRPGREAQAAATVSSGLHDPGGVSYGAYQLASSVRGGRQVQAFLRREGAPWAPQLAGLDPARRHGAFGRTWREIASRSPVAFFNAQHDYIRRTHYEHALRLVNEASHVDLSARSIAVRNVVWSMSVQHGRAARLIGRALDAAGPQGRRPDGEYDRALINALYDVREAYADAIGQPGLRTRYRRERADALAELDADEVVPAPAPDPDPNPSYRGGFGPLGPGWPFRNPDPTPGPPVRFAALAAAALLAAGVAPLSPARAEPPGAGYAACQKAAAGVDPAMQRCAAAEIGAREAALNRTYQQLLAAVEPPRKVQLRAAERAWLAFREAECGFRTSAETGGSITRLIDGECRIELTGQRIEQLQKALKAARF